MTDTAVNSLETQGGSKCNVNHIPRGRTTELDVSWVNLLVLSHRSRDSSG